MLPQDTFQQRFDVTKCYSVTSASSEKTPLTHELLYMYSLRGSMMAASVYSFTLDLIRRGIGQLQSYQAARARFPESTIENVYSQWLSAWAGKYTADSLREASGSTLQDWLNVQPIGTGQPAIDASPKIIQSWISAFLSDPYDINIITATSTGQFVEYNTWRYRAYPDSQFAMFQRTIDGIIVKEYLRGGDGTTRFIQQYLIGTPKVV